LATAQHRHFARYRIYFCASLSLCRVNAGRTPAG
jgi:hypothetical protein